MGGAQERPAEDHQRRRDRSLPRQRAGEAAALAGANTSTPSRTCASSRAWRRCRPTTKRAIPPFNPLELYADADGKPRRGQRVRDAASTAASPSTSSSCSAASFPTRTARSSTTPRSRSTSREAKEAETEAEIIRAGAEADAQPRPAGDDGTPLGAESCGRYRAAQHHRAHQADAGRGGHARRPRGPRDAGRQGRRQATPCARSCSRAGADTWQARGMIEAARNIFPEASLARRPGGAHHAGSLAHPKDRKEPARFSIFSDGHDHLVTVTRNAAGEFVASKSPAHRGGDRQRRARRQRQRLDVEHLRQRLLRRSAAARAADDSIMKVMKIHASRDRLPPPPAARRCGRVLLRHEGRSARPTLRLASCSTRPSPAAARRYRFYRFRTPDGARRLLRRERQQLEASSSCAARCAATCASPPASACASIRC